MAVNGEQDTGLVRRPSLADKLKLPRSPRKVMAQTREELKKQADRLAKKADEHEHLINKITYYIGVAMFGTFCFLLGSKPQSIPYLYCLFFLTALPLRWIYYRSKKWHYYLLDFCYYANVIFIAMLLFFPNNDKLYMVCFSFSEGPLAWAIIVWRCSLVFSSIDKIVSVLIHLLPGTVLFIIRWWDPITYMHHPVEETGPWPAWPVVVDEGQLWMWLFAVPLFVYAVWQMLYWIIVHGLRSQRILNDPEVMTSFRELSRKAAKANNIFWRLSGVLGADHRVMMYAVFQALFTVATLALTVPMFKHYHLHLFFQIFKGSAAIWNGGNFFFDVMPRQVVEKKQHKASAPMAAAAGGTAGAVGVDSQNGKEQANGGPASAAASSSHGISEAVMGNGLGHGIGTGLGQPTDDDDGSVAVCSLCHQPSGDLRRRSMEKAWLQAMAAADSVCGEGLEAKEAEATDVNDTRFGEGTDVLRKGCIPEVISNGVPLGGLKPMACAS